MLLNLLPLGVGAVPALEDIIDAAIETALGRVETAQPGIVTSFDKRHHTVDVQPLFMKSHVREDGETVTTRQPIIPSVPIWFMGAGDSRFTFPVPKGSTVLLVHLSGPKAAWQFSGGSAPVETDDPRRHQLTDAVAIPGGLTSKVASRNFATGSSRIADDGLIIHTPGKIYLGGGSTKPIMRDIDVQNAIISVLTDLDVVNAILAYPAAAAINAVAAKADLTFILNTHFNAEPVTGSSVTESE